MTPSPHRRLMLGALLAAACSETPATPLVPPAVVSDELSFTLPSFDPLTLATTVLVDSGGVGSASPARVLEPSEEPPDYTLESSEPRSNIYDARTIAAIAPGRGMAFGEHRYQGNKGRIETTINLQYGGQQIGSQTSVTEQAGVFFNLFTIKYISAAAYVYTQLQCDLMAWGKSEHSAWLEAALGAGATVFDRTVRGTRSDPVYSEPCPPPPPPPTTGSGGGGGGGGQCYVEYWYYEDTGEIIDWRVLYCEQVGG